MPGTTGSRLDDEQRARVRDCLLKADLVLPATAFKHFVRDIEGSILRFHVASPTTTRREAHDALRSVWRLAHHDGPSIGLLRIRVKALPRGAIEYIDRRARSLISRLFPGDSADTGFLAWAEKADGDKLVRALRVLAAEGGKLADRSRGGGKHSRSHLEPMIFGEVRGIGAKKCKGGRPSRDAQHGSFRHTISRHGAAVRAGYSSNPNAAPPEARSLVVQPPLTGAARNGPRGRLRRLFA